MGPAGLQIVLCNTDGIMGPEVLYNCIALLISGIQSVATLDNTAADNVVSHWLQYSSRGLASQRSSSSQCAGHCRRPEEQNRLAV
jgi:hypothetical protein